MDRKDLLGKWKLLSFGTDPIDRISILTLKDDGTAIEETNDLREVGRWKFIDEFHWNTYFEIEPAPNTPGLEDGAIDVSEYQIASFSEKRMEVEIFDFESTIVYERIA